MCDLECDQDGICNEACSAAFIENGTCFTDLDCCPECSCDNPADCVDLPEGCPTPGCADYNPLLIIVIVVVSIAAIVLLLSCIGFYLLKTRSKGDKKDDRLIVEDIKGSPRYKEVL